MCSSQDSYIYNKSPNCNLLNMAEKTFHSFVAIIDSKYKIKCIYCVYYLFVFFVPIKFNMYFVISPETLDRFDSVEEAFF